MFKQTAHVEYLWYQCMACVVESRHTSTPSPYDVTVHLCHQIFRMSSYVGGFGIIVLFMEITYLVFTLYFLARMVRLVRKERMRYFKDFWNMLEFATLVMGIVAIAMYAMKKLFGAFAMKLLAESGSGRWWTMIVR